MKLAEHLIEVGRATPERVAETESYARREGLQFEEALVKLGVAGFPDLGEFASGQHGLPYVPLTARPPQPSAAQLMSAACARRWQMLPVEYNAGEELLTIAVHDPGQIPRIESVYRLFLQPFSLAFSVASEAEIKKALRTYTADAPAEAERGSRQASGASPAEATPKQKLSGLHEARARRRQDQAAGKGGSQGKGRRGKKKSEKTPRYEQMSRPLLSAAALLVQAHLRGDTRALDEARARVRYCQLLASRLGLSPVRADAVVLAAWLSALENRSELVKQFSSPYQLEEILYPPPEAGRRRAEAWVVSLVRTYQSLQQKDPGRSRDVNLTRNALRLGWSSAPEQQEMLEIFLQVLMDEQFLAKLGRVAGRILIVDPTEVATSHLTPPLMRDGYEVTLAADASSARKAMEESVPDVILAATNLGGESGLTLCREIRNNQAKGRVPLLMLARQEDQGREAECLRAGADDFLAKPVDLELLFLKIQRLLAVPGETDRSGVSGSLEDMSFTDMIQILCAGGKSMKIMVSREGEEGTVYIRNGEIVDATCGESTGENAFYALMRWSSGEFTMSQCTDYPGRTIASPAMSLLMEGARQADEDE